MPLICHVGSGKTGTTSIQKAFSEREANEASSLVYPVVGDSDHNCLEALVRPPNEWHRVNRMHFRDNPEALVERAESLAHIVERKARAGKNVLLSSEYLFSLTSPQIERLIDRLGVCPDQVSVIIYIRDPKRYFCSHMQQIVKHDFAVRAPSVSQYKFKRSICEWRNVLGHDVVSVLGFEPEVDTHGDIVASFLFFLKRELGINIDDVAASTEPVNVSMSSEEAIALQELKYAFGLSPRARLQGLNRAINTWIREASRPLKLSKAAFVPLLNQHIDKIFADDLEWLSKHYHLTFPGANVAAPESRDRQGEAESESEPIDFSGYRFEFGEAGYLKLRSVLQHDTKALRKLKLRAGRKFQLRLK